MWLVFIKIGKNITRVNENVECKKISIEFSDYGVNPDQNQLKHYNQCHSNDMPLCPNEYRQAL